MEFMTVAHRAGNDMDEVRRVSGVGGHVIEVDVHLFRSRLEARHLKTFGPIRLYWDRWEIRRPSTVVVGFDELLAATSSELLVDLKGGSRRLSRLVAETIETREAVTWVCSRRWRHLERLRSVQGVRVVASAGSRAQLRRLLRRFPPGTLDGVSVDRRLLDVALVTQLRDRFGLVLTWRVNDIESAQLLLDWGVNGLISDRYDLLDAFAEIGSPRQELGKRPTAGEPVAEHRQAGTSDRIEHEMIGGRDDGDAHRNR